MAVTGSISINTSTNQDISNVPGLAPIISTQQNLKFVFGTSGTGVDSVDRKHTRSYTIAASTPLVLDLKTLLAVDGSAVAFTKVKSITIVNKNTNDAHVLLMGYATTTSNAWVSLLSNPGQITIGPSTIANPLGGIYAQTSPNVSGWAVGASNKLLQLDPGANTINVDVEICGTSA